PMTSSISLAKFTRSGLSSSLPASIFERSRTSLMRLRRWAPAPFTRRSGSSAFSEPNRAALVTIISVRPMMALSGIGGGDRRRIDFIPIREQDDDCSTRKQLQPALDDRIEHRLSVIERIADDAEYPRGRRLLLQRLSKIVRALAQFVEQAAVLDSDDRLIGEARDQLDLLVSEGTNVLAVNADHADELVLLQHRDGHKGPGTAIFCDRRVGAFRRHVCDLDRPHCVDCVSKVRGR